jgi:Fe-S-cluster containining protein
MENLRIKFKNANDPCKESGCDGLCCNDPLILMEASTRARVFPDALEVSEDTDFKDPNLPSGQYFKDTGYRSDSGWEKLVEYKAVNMPCPHKLKGGGCGIYKNRPDGCKHFTFGGKSCDETRVGGGLITINQILIADRG